MEKRVSRMVFIVFLRQGWHARSAACKTCRSARNSVYFRARRRFELSYAQLLQSVPQRFEYALQDFPYSASHTPLSGGSRVSRSCCKHPDPSPTAHNNLRFWKVNVEVRKIPTAALIHQPGAIPVETGVSRVLVVRACGRYGTVRSWAGRRREADPPIAAGCARVCPHDPLLDRMSTFRALPAMAPAPL